MTPLTSSQILGAVTERLAAGGYQQVADTEDGAGTQVRVFEDARSVVAVAIYDSWLTLDQRWPMAQGLLVELMSAHLARSEPKAWEGYLILLTTDEPIDDALAVDRVRRDTSRVRKIVATGADLLTLGAVNDSLLAVLPLELGAVTDGSERILDRLPELLAPFGVDRELARRVVGAFEDNRSPMEEIWTWRRAQ